MNTKRPILGKDDLLPSASDPQAAIAVAVTACRATRDPATAEQAVYQGLKYLGKTDYAQAVAMSVKTALLASTSVDAAIDAVKQSLAGIDVLGPRKPPTVRPSWMSDVNVSKDALRPAPPSYTRERRAPGSLASKFNFAEALASPGTRPAGARSDDGSSEARASVGQPHSSAGSTKEAAPKIRFRLAEDTLAPPPVPPPVPARRPPSASLPVYGPSKPEKVACPPFEKAGGSRGAACPPFDINVNPQDKCQTSHTYRRDHITSPVVDAEYSVSRQPPPPYFQRLGKSPGKPRYHVLRTEHCDMLLDEYHSETGTYHAGQPADGPALPVHSESEEREVPPTPKFSTDGQLVHAGQRKPASCGPLFSSHLKPPSATSLNFNTF